MTFGLSCPCDATRTGLEKRVGHGCMCVLAIIFLLKNDRHGGDMVGT